VAAFSAAASVGKLPELSTILDPPPPDTRTAEALAKDFTELEDMAAALNRR